MRSIFAVALLATVAPLALSPVSAHQAVAVATASKPVPKDQLLKPPASADHYVVVSDAGTPLVSDPGYVVARAVIAAGLPVHPVPGASSLLAALCLAGLPADRVVFEGFLPPKSAARWARRSSTASRYWRLPARKPSRSVPTAAKRLTSRRPTCRPTPTSGRRLRRGRRCRPPRGHTIARRPGWR